MAIFGFGKSPEERFAEFARKSLDEQRTVALKLLEARALVMAIKDALLNADPTLTSDMASAQALAGLRLSCPGCGDLTPSAMSVAVMAGEGGAFGQASQVALGGPNVSAISEGRCPRCRGKRFHAKFVPPAKRT